MREGLRAQSLRKKRPRHRRQGEIKYEALTALFKYPVRTAQ